MSDSDYVVTSAEDAQGRVLSGVGAAVEDLEKTMERHAEPAEAPAATEPAAPVEPKVSRGQKRFSELTSERDKERNAREAAERERDELRARLAEPRTVQEPRSTPEPVVSASATSAGTVESTRPKPAEGDVGTKYPTYADFIEDLADWKAEQRLSAQDFDARIRNSIEADRASRTQADHVNQAKARGQQAYTDFNAVISAPHMATPWPVDKIQAIAQLEQPEHIQYQLGKDPALAERLRTLDPVGFGMELSKLIAAPAVASPASTAVAGSSMPPAPYQPVGSGSKTTAPPLDDLVKKAGHDFDKSGYREKRAEQLGRMRRR